jgi:hypothetical protein
MTDRFVRNFSAKVMAQGFVEGVRFVSPEVADAMVIVENHDPPPPPWSHGTSYAPQQRWAVMRKPLTEEQKKSLAGCGTDADDALDRLGYLERKLAAVQAVVDAARGVIKGADPAYGLIDALAELDAMPGDVATPTTEVPGAHMPGCRRATSATALGEE